MGIMDKVMFWKKNDDMGDMGGDLGSPFDNPPGGPPGGPDLGGPPPGPGGMPPVGGAPGESGLGTQGADHLGLSNSGLPQSDSEPFMPAPSLAASPNQPAPPQPPMLQVAPPAPPPVQGAGNNQELEVISAKLDSIRASIESLTIRIGNIESVMRSEHETKKELNW